MSASSKRSTARQLSIAYLLLASGIALFIGYPLLVRAGVVHRLLAQLDFELVLIFGVGGGLICTLIVLALRTGEAAEARLENHHLPRIEPVSSSLLLFATCCALALTAATAIWLLRGAEQAVDGERVMARIQAVQISVMVGGGAVGLFAVVLAFRKQWLNERSQLHVEQNAADRQSSDSYFKAVDRLAHRNPTVRTAGLYELEALANSCPSIRQQIVNVICDYLRQPYAGTHGSPRDDDVVRRTAQNIVAGSLRFNRVTGWLDIDVDLSNATLVDFDFSSCCLKSANFSGACFHGEAKFMFTKISEHADFCGASFEGLAYFDAMNVGRVADYSDTCFASEVSFIGTHIAVMTLSNARFLDDLDLRSASIIDACSVAGVTASASFGMSSVRIGEILNMAGAAFGGDVDFTDVVLPQSTLLAGARVLNPRGDHKLPWQLRLDPETGLMVRLD